MSGGGIDVESIHLALQQSFSADSHIRQPAEKIKEFEKSRGCGNVTIASSGGKAGEVLQ